MIALLNQLIGPWTRVRQSLSDDLDHIQAALNQAWGQVFTKNNQLQPGAIAGDPTPATRYVANTGPSNAPNWDQVDLTNGVKKNLPLANLAPASGPSKLIGRGSAAGAGTYQEITVGAGLTMIGTTLENAGAAFEPLTNGDLTFPELIFVGGDVIMVPTTF